MQWNDSNLSLKANIWPWLKVQSEGSVRKTLKSVLCNPSNAV